MATSSASREPFDEAWEDYSREIKEQIRSMAVNQAGPSRVGPAESYRALDEFFRGLPPKIPKSLQTKANEKARGFAGWIDTNLFLLVAVLMTLVFAYLGRDAIDAAPNSAGAQQAKAFLDIAKVFAGAIVGSAAGRGVARRRQSG